MSKPSLLERCQGPGATDISTLVNRAQQTAENVCRDYSIYLLEKIQGIKELIAAHRDVETQTEDHQALLQEVRDLRSSAAMAGYDWIAQCSQSLESSLTTREVFDTDLPVIVRLHLDAIELAAQGKCKAEELLLLETGLRRAVETLGRPFPISP
jgi:HPt (histidine-containing phosphotransfer) domain-containing protein